MDTTQNVATATAKSAPTSEKLTQIEAAIVTKNAEIKAAFINDADSDTLEKLQFEKFALVNDRKAEIANIEKLQREAEIVAKRNEKLAVLTAAIQSGIEASNVNADKKATDEAKAAANEAAKAAYEAAANLIIGSVTVKAAATSDSGSGSKKAAEIVSEYVAALAANNGNHTAAMKAVVDAGTPRGSAWKPIDDYRKANNLK